MLYMNKMFSGLIFLLLFGFCFADSISAYQVPTAVPLNQNITATGLFDSNSEINGIKCSFYIFDSDSKLVYQATEQFTNTIGRFAMTGKKVTEPAMVRGQTYSLQTECGSAVATADFTVDQKQEAFDVLGFKFYPQGGMMDLMYIRDNGVMLFFFFIIAMVILSMIIIGATNFF